MSVDQRARIDRGYRAAEVLRHTVMQEAATELNQRAFNDFLGSSLTEKGEEQRERALRLVHGAEAFLAILHEWVIEARELQAELEQSNV